MAQSRLRRLDHRHCTAAEAHDNLVLTKSLDLSARTGMPVDCSDWEALEARLKLRRIADRHNKRDRQAFTRHEKGAGGQ